MQETPAHGPSAGNWLKSRSEAIVAIVCLVTVLLLGLVDFFAPREFKLTAFYLLLIAFAAWSGGKRVGLLIVAASALILLAREIKFAVNHSLDWIGTWNMVMCFGIYFLTARVMSALRILTSDLKWRMSDQTGALERELAERTRTEEQLRKTIHQLRELTDNISDVVWMRDADTMRIGYVNPAYETIWGCDTRELYLRCEVWLDSIHGEDRERINRAIVGQISNGGYDEEFRIVRADGSTRWIRERTFPIRDGTGKIVRIVGIAEDNTDRRRMEREIIEVSDREHARIGQDLHDGLCQKLIALAFDVGSLEQKLAVRAVAETESVRQMSTLLDELITEARGTARGLFPVQLESDGLSAALQQLVANVNSRAKLICRMDSSETAMISDNATATHLYRIAQEAVNNALKHSKAKNLWIQLNESDNRVELRVMDDGIGIPLSRAKNDGMGLHIMEYRARLIGGTLSVSRSEKGGTAISCSAPIST